MAICALSLCAGVGGLDLGCHAAFEHLGIGWRAAAYVEREAYAAAQLVALMEAGCMDQAPVWSDLLTFDARAWRGAVDCVIAGFPCQPHSVAGKRAGTSDERWIWPAIVRIIRDSGAWLVVLENVRGLLSSGGMDAVLADLAGIGFAAEWAVLAASAVGASHRRERVFIVGVADPSQPRPQGARSGLAQWWREPVACNGDRGVFPFFAPGPSDKRWPDILAERPYLAPATQPGIRGLVDGHTLVVDESRRDQLRCLGNGVVPLQAAVAVVELVRRLMKGVDQ